MGLYFTGNVGFGFAVKYEDSEEFAKDFLKNYELATGDVLTEDYYDSLEDFYLGGVKTPAGIYLVTNQYEDDLSKWLIAYDAESLNSFEKEDVHPKAVTDPHNEVLDKLAILMGTKTGALFHTVYA